MTVKPTGEVHAVANLFPMLADDELQEMADDIRANGLREPIVLTQSGVLVDGRNRIAACKLASVEPRYVVLNGQDPAAYILSLNVWRRHLTKGQRAMAVVLAAEHSQSKRTDVLLSQDADVSVSLLQRAVSVRRYTPALAEQVMAGTLPMAEAQEEARKVKAIQQGEDARLGRLRTTAPDLAERVDAGMALAEAEAALVARQKAIQERQQHVTRAVVTAVEASEGVCGSQAVREGTIAEFVPALAKGSPMTRARLEALAGAYAALAEGWDHDGGELASGDGADSDGGVCPDDEYANADRG